ncbi:hypothetical protein FB192DRAFT_1341309 [Mucor lusitanicus]|uniref:Uncharacterized protein n=1 Tax=Mucor circinelloides f. lusitanicus TaxID=29924 RepID=A0A8H4BKC6_MUCCL|nr:hypothetical protein FB192DRAFT_1341309 [Mucor lusitanicus]
MSRRWMRLCLQRNKWLCGRYQLSSAKSIRHAQTHNQCSAVNDKVKLAVGYTPRNGDSHLLWWMELTFGYITVCCYFQTQMNTQIADSAQMNTSQVGRAWYSVCGSLQNCMQEMLLVVDKLRFGKCICMKQQSKDKRKGFNMEWAASGW